MVMQLLHSIKYSVEVPFSNIAQQPTEIQKLNSTKKVGHKIFIIINTNTFHMHENLGRNNSKTFMDYSILHFSCPPMTTCAFSNFYYSF